MELTITVRREPTDRCVLVLDGALDLASRDGLLESARLAGDDTAVGHLVLDLAGVTFIDSTGLGAMVKLAGAADDAGIDFSLAAPSERVRRILDVTGLTGVWPIES